MPNVGTPLSTSAFAFATAYGSAAGSPGPLLRNTPSGFMASSSDAGVVAGNTRTSHPYAVKRRRMFHFIPKSYAAIRNGRPPRASTAGANSSAADVAGFQSNAVSHVTP